MDSIMTLALTFGSLFAGIGGFDLGFERAGMTCKWQGDIDEYCNRVRRKHWPDIPQFGDIRECGAHNLEPVDVICGGFPCQPFSVAGQRRGKDDDRYLWPEMFRVISELRPTWVVGENVTGIESMVLRDILIDLESVGYEAIPIGIPACGVDTSHKRLRTFILAHTENAIGRRPSAAEDSGGRYPEAGGCGVSNRGLQHWGTEPRMDRVAYGVPYRVDRHRCLGNAVVPQVAQVIGEMIVAVAQRKVGGMA